MGVARNAGKHPLLAHKEKSSGVSCPVPAGGETLPLGTANANLPAVLLPTGSRPIKPREKQDGMTAWRVGGPAFC